MALIWKNILYFIKIFLVHPATEITLNIMYLMSFLVIGLILFKSNQNYNDLQILDMTESYLNYNIFSNIKTPSQFNSYLLSILDKLYTMALNRFIILKDPNKWIIPSNLNIALINDNKKLESDKRQSYHLSPFERYNYIDEKFIQTKEYKNYFINRIFI